MTGWSKPRKINGPPPIGECETRCTGCRRRFISGEDYVSRRVALMAIVYAHPACALSLNEAA